MISRFSRRARLLALSVSVLALLLAAEATARPSDRFSVPQSPSAAPVDDLPALLRRAEAGDADAQYQVGIAYQFSLGTPRNDAAARSWFAKAAAQNHIRALASLGYMLSVGAGGPVDVAGAEKALRRAGEAGEASAWANMAELVLHQRPAETAEAMALLERAVAAGATNARYRLGRFLIEGEVIAADPARGRKLLDEAAEQGHPLAETYLAYLIYEARDEAQAGRGFALVRRAANADLAVALNELGRYHMAGFGTSRDPRRAASAFATAGEQGEPSGWYNLALLHNDPQYGMHNQVLARQAALRAADMGHIPAAGLAGQMLFKAEGGPRDRSAARPYLQRAAEGGIADAQSLLAGLLFNGDGVPADQTAAMDWWEKAVAQGHGAAVNNFATYLATGRGRPADPARAQTLIAAQAEAGYAPSQFRWGLWQEQGWQGTRKDLPAAIRWFRRAAENGHASGAFKYAAYLEAGEGIKADIPAARHWYGIGAEGGNSDAQFQLARMLEAGEGGAADPAAARRWLDRAAKQGHPEALFVLGDLTYRGEGRPADPALAWAYLRLAEEYGMAEAGGNRRYIESRLLPSELARAQAMAQQLAAGIRREREDE
ncbi:sel1 repeat family protein [Ferrovibrio terrae]|uniref:Sel1 repeat family protein n=1 Tax=Ferrovibrio terrae TaxID=2594003 RepID=A0A516H5T2_9PROT|nr:tetratricopeptide repeat protein [Ferrovibrio terrae]QDO99154.1 sel1 repeat family protein [Ferrovibrio terrae]